MSDEAIGGSNADIDAILPGRFAPDYIRLEKPQEPLIMTAPVCQPCQKAMVFIPENLLWQCACGNRLDGDDTPIEWVDDGGPVGPDGTEYDPMSTVTLHLTDEEMEALRNMVISAICDGFSPPEPEHIAIVRKLGIERNDLFPYVDEYSEAFQ